MMKEDFSINFSGITHDHATLNNNHSRIIDNNDNNNQKENDKDDSSCSTIAILRRHPMYDSLVLVKKYKNCLNGYSLEFPSDNLNDDEEARSSVGQEVSSSAEKRNKEEGDGVKGSSDYHHNSNNENNNKYNKSCNRRRLVSRFLDGDDPMYQSCSINGIEMNINDSSLGPSYDITRRLSNNVDHSTLSGSSLSLSHPFAPQIDDKGELCELVHVPINGLLDRLRNYTESGVAVDSRVYAFAMGLKTAERILATSSMKEPQETPI